VRRGPVGRRETDERFTIKQQSTASATALKKQAVDGFLMVNPECDASFVSGSCDFEPEIHF
jgi:hypothetical protein